MSESRRFPSTRYRYLRFIRRLLQTLLPAVLLIAGLQAQAGITSFQQEREIFRQASHALEQRDRPRFEQLLKELKQYPARAYLRFDAISQDLATLDNKQIREFLETYRDYPFAYHLRTRWLSLLAKRGQWQSYLTFYDGRSAVKFKCLQLTARLKTGQVDDNKAFNREIRKIWSSGYSQPEQCDIPFEHFLSTSEDIDQAIWQRIEKAFAARRPSLARYLAKKLPDEERAQVEQWYQAHQRPAQQLERMIDLPDTALNRKIIIHALDRLARRDSPKASQFWEQYHPVFAFSPAQKNRIQKRIALSASLQHLPESKKLLQQLPDKLKSDNAHLWLARIHLRDEDWIGLIKTIRAMPRHLRSEAEWTYWLARAYEEAGQQAKAQILYQQLSRRGSYYGFLAADRIGRDYHIVQQSAVEASPLDESKLLESNIHLLRARELFFLDRPLDARREWFQGIRKLDQQQIKQAASMASGWKWYDNAIKTVAKTPHRNDYDLRFPMPFRQQVTRAARQKDLDLSVVYGLMRRESLFDPLARSRVGALGLMQLMPTTARHVAKALGLKRPRTGEILSIDKNILLGTSYFRSVLNRFDNNVSLAAAAYNAGPRNVRKWLPRDESIAADLWVETVPFKETRNYVQAVLAYATIFDKHLGKQVQISSRMDDVKPDYSRPNIEKTAIQK